MAESQSFTFDVGGAVQGQMPQGAAPANIGFTGNAGPSTVSIAPGIDFAGDNSGKTISMLMKLGGDLLEPHVKAARTQKAAEGAIAALQGVSAAEIQAAEPMQGFFGDSVTVASARQVEQMNAVNKLSNNVLTDMETLKEQSPEEFRKWLPQQLNSLMLGDPASDALITQAFMERVPGIVDGHSKAHAGFVQEKARQAWSGNLDGKAEAFALTFEQSGETGNSTLLAKQAFVEALAGPDGIHASAYPGWINQAYKRLASSGNLRALQVIEDSQVLDATQTDAQRDALNKARNAAESIVAARNPALLIKAGDRGRIEASISLGASPFRKESEVLGWIAGYNSEFMNTYGGSKPPIDINAAGNIVQAWYAGEERAQRRAAEGSGNDIMGAVAEYKALIGAGKTYGAQGRPDMTSEVKRLAQDSWFQELKDKPSELAGLAVRDPDLWPAVQSELQGVTEFFKTGGGFNAQTAKGFDFLQRMHQIGPEGDVMIGKYLGEKYGGIALEALRMGLDADNPEQMNQLSERLIKTGWEPHRDLSKEELTEVKESVSSALGEGLFNFSGPYSTVQLSDRAKDQLVNIVQPLVSGYMKGTSLPVSSATRMAIGTVMGNVDFVGGIPVLGNRLSPDEKDNTFSKAVARAAGLPALTQSAENYQRALDGVLEAKLRARPGSERMFFGGIRDVIPEPVNGTFIGSGVSMTYEDENGVLFPVVVTVSDMVTALSLVQEAKRKPTKPTSVTYETMLGAD